MWFFENVQILCSNKKKFQKLRLEFHHKLLSCLNLDILSNYLTWCISIILLSLSSDIEINLGPKSSRKECLSICHWNLNDTFNWDPCMGEQPLQGMELKEKE